MVMTEEPRLSRSKCVMTSYPVCGSYLTFMVVIMNVQDLVARLDREISRLRRARELLVPLTEQSPRGRGRPKTKANTPSAASAPKEVPKRQMTAEGRQRIRDAQKARWAARKSTTESKLLAEEVTVTEPKTKVLVEA